MSTATYKADDTTPQASSSFRTISARGTAGPGVSAVGRVAW